MSNSFTLKFAIIYAILTAMTANSETPETYSITKLGQLFQTISLKINAFTVNIFSWSRLTVAQKNSSNNTSKDLSSYILTVQLFNQFLQAYGLSIKAKLSRWLLSGQVNCFLKKMQNAKGIILNSNCILGEKCACSSDGEKKNPADWLKKDVRT